MSHFESVRVRVRGAGSCAVIRVEPTRYTTQVSDGRHRRPTPCPDHTRARASDLTAVTEEGEEDGDVETAVDFTPLGVCVEPENHPLKPGSS